MRVGGLKKMGYGRKPRSFSQMNEVRRKRAIQQRELREARAARRREIAQNAIERMASNANIFSIKVNQSFNNVDMLIRAAQQRRIDQAIARSEETRSNTDADTGANADVSA